MSPQSKAVSVAPIVLPSDRCQGNLYLAGKNTFLEFYTDEDKAIKRHACARSASADSQLKRSQILAQIEVPSIGSLKKNTSFCTQITQSTSTPTHRSSSPSDRSVLSCDNGVLPNAELQSPDATPRTCWADVADNTYDYCGATSELMPVVAMDANPDFGPMVAAMAQVTAATKAAMNAIDAPNNHHRDCDFSASAGHPMPQMPMMMPMSMCAYENQTMAHTPRVVKPRKVKRETEREVKPTKKCDTETVIEVDTPAAEDGITVMMRGIPCSFSQQALISCIDDAGLKDKYNFFYLPRDGNRRANLGYAFLNFVDEQSAKLCEETFQGVNLSPGRSKKTCTISPAAIQGLPSLWKHFHNKAVSRGSHAPMFLNV